MARGKKWTIPFKSLNGTDCVVDIYEEGYSGAVTELSTNNPNSPGYPTANPFEIIEDDSNDLTHFIRYKTGSLRMLETTYGGLTALMPRNLRDHFIEAWYGTERVFSGFMQCQEFDNDWVAAPRVMEFPVISPLGLLETYNFEAPSQPGMVTLGSLMNEVMVGLNPDSTGTDSDYTSVVYPVSGEYSPWDNVISSMVMCPFNDSFRHYDNAAKLYAPKDYKYFIEGICACFGWTVHDTPDSIVFAKYNYDGNYSRVTVSGLLTLTGWSDVQQLAGSFNSYYANADNNALQSVIMPLKQINLNLEGVEIKSKELGTEHATANGLMEGGANFRGVAMNQIGPDVDGGSVATFTTNGEISGGGLYPIAYGIVDQDAVSVGLQDFWVLKYDSSVSSPFITAKFFGQAPKDTSGYCLLKLKMERGTSLQDMKTQDYDDILLELEIKVGKLYADLGTGNMTSYPTLNAITIDGQTGKVTPNDSLSSSFAFSDVDGIIFRPTNGWLILNDPIEVSLYVQSGLNDGDYVKITEISIKNPGAVDEAYNAYYNDRDKITIGGNSTGTEERDITVNFNNYATHRGEHSFGSAYYTIDGGAPTMPYMFAPLHVLTQKVKRIRSVTFNEYAAKWTYWISGWRWRMLAKNFNLRDDEYQITLARSQTIE